MTISREDHSKGPRAGSPGPETGKFGPAYPGNTQKSQAQDVKPKEWAPTGDSGGDTVAHPWYGKNAQQSGN